MNEFGKYLFLIGLIVAGAGLLIWSGFGRGWIGRLPGDLNFNRGYFSLHFPIVTCLLLSLILSILLWIFRK